MLSLIRAHAASGDLVVTDADGFVYFKDRVGDTFRWKGENVATTEVAEVLCTFPAIESAIVYGVQVNEHTDGRAGMACLVLRTSAGPVDFAALYAHVEAALPPYARPLFLRVRRTALDVGEHLTATFKHRKLQLQAEVSVRCGRAGAGGRC